MEDKDLGIDFLNTWTDAINTLRESLERHDMESVERYTSWNDLQSILVGSHMTSISPETHALDPLKAFFEFFETRLGTNLDTNFLWGALTHLLRLASQLPLRLVDEKQNILYMIKSLARTAETFMLCCEDARVVNDSIKIKCVVDDSPRSDGNTSQSIQGFYEKTDKELKVLLKQVEEQARTKASIGTQLVPIIGPSNAVSRLLMLPPTKTDQLYDRVVVFQNLDNLLGVRAGTPFFREKFFDVILWARGENSVSLRQSFTEIAIRLKLPGAQHHAHDENLLLVQDWLQSTNCKWLIVYDNVESSETLMPYWPGSYQGKAIITTSNRSVAFKSASHISEITSWEGKDGTGFLLFLLENKNHIGKNKEEETDSASILAERLGGHAFAIKQIATLIHSSQSSIHDFLTMYSKDAERVHRTEELGKVMQWSFQKLNKKSLSLLGMMSFLNPDIISQNIFDADVNRESSNDFLDALDELIKYTLVKKDIDTRVLSVHKIVQTRFKSFLSAVQREEAFNNIVALLYNSLPKEDTPTPQLYENWEIYDKYLSHVLKLRDSFTEEKKNSESFKVQWEFCELCIQYERYLYEINDLAELEILCTVNLTAMATLEDSPRKHSLNATIMSHQANLAETQGKVEIAINLNKEVYRIRSEELSLEHNLLCQVANNIGYCYNSSNDHTTALTWFLLSYQSFEKSEETKNDFLPGNMARCMLYLNQLDAAWEMLDIAIPQLENSNSSNWAMLSYAYFIGGLLERRQHNFQSAEAYFKKAQGLWLKGDLKRLHPFNGGCMYKIGACCLDQGKVAAAIEHIEDSMTVTRFHKMSMPVEHARNLFKASEALLQDDKADSKDKAENYRMQAETLLKMRNPDIIACDTEDIYDNLIPIFWR
ncbi:uncharacterized protein TRUGW13939_01660 [Talaromyces rugulosus]|uniref:DUF7779 domain-containing protein n=1 Tax=Talaromyces rugulosus TaxID=121627 RepID=A0A7H8QN09_TALRU|nr:uncharacterized protein TRUGW13939_01660 [Talaromyces rugulosus]QKX54573.1 hypothetical protein TRUGW13939_01660 [Talaromyces rugulosus]